MYYSKGALLLKLSCFMFILTIHILLCLHYKFICDDAFISFRYLKNWLEGYGLVYNPGDRVEGYTNLLWILLLAPFVKLGLPPENIAHFFTMFFSSLLLFLIFLFPCVVTKTEIFSIPKNRNNLLLDFSPLLAPFLVSLNRSYAVWATGGLETRMFSFLCFCGIMFILRAIEKPTICNLIFSGLFFGFSELARPEGTMFGLICFSFYFFVMVSKKKGIHLKEFVLGVSLFFVIVLAHYLWRLIYYGLPFPNTYYAKLDKPWFEMGTFYLWMFCFEYSYYIIGLPVLFLIINSVRKFQPVPLLFIILIIPYIFYIAYLGGDHFEYRILDPLLPLFSLLLAMSFIMLLKLSRYLFLKIMFSFIFFILVIYHIGFPIITEAHSPKSIPVSGNFSPKADPDIYPLIRHLPFMSKMAKYFNENYAKMIPHMVGNRREDHSVISKDLMFEAMKMKEFIEKGYLAQSERLCIGTAGIIPYYTNMWTLDFHGLADRQVAMQKVKGHYVLYHDKKATPDYIRSLKIDYVQFTRMVVKQENYGKELPIIILRESDMELFEGLGSKLYLVLIDDVYFSFLSSREPEEIISRFKGRGLKIYVYEARGERGKMLLPTEG